jgi:hypothetical protein
METFESHLRLVVPAGATRHDVPLRLSNDLTRDRADQQNAMTTKSKGPPLAALRGRV